MDDDANNEWQWDVMGHAPQQPRTISRSTFTSKNNKRYVIEVGPDPWIRNELSWVAFEYLDDGRMHRPEHQDEDGVIPDDVANYGSALVHEAYINYYRNHAKV